MSTHIAAGGCTTGACPAAFTTSTGVDYPGNDLVPKSVAYTLEACEYACYNLPACKAFVFTGTTDNSESFTPLTLPFV